MAAEPPTQLVEDLFRKLLDAGPVEPDTDFFEAGGTSLMAARLVGELRRDGWPVTLDDALSGRTPRGVAEAALRARSDDDTTSARDYLDHVEAEVLHHCETAFAPTRISLVRPLPSPITGLSTLLGVDLPEPTRDKSPATIAEDARTRGAVARTPIALTLPEPTLPGHGRTTLFFAPHPANIMDLRRAVAGRRFESAVWGFLPRSLPDDPALRAATFDHLVDEAVEATERIPGPYRLIGYCASSWVAAAVADRLTGAGHDVTFVAINPPTLPQLAWRDLRYYVAHSVFHVDYDALPAGVAAALDRAYRNWQDADASLTETADAVANAVAGGLDELLPDYDAAARTLFLTILRVQIAYQFSIARAAKPTTVPADVFVTEDATYLDVTSPIDVSLQPTIQGVDVPLRALLRHPPAATVIFGPYT